MSTNIIFNGNSYIVPAIGDAAWGNNVSNYLIAIASGCLQKTGGTFTLTADANFGASFGLQGLYFKSVTTNIASTGVMRLAKTDSIAWRNNANGANLALAINGSDVLQFNSISLADVSTSQTISNKTIDNTNTIAVKVGNLTLEDGADTSKQAVFSLSGMTTGKTLTLASAATNNRTITIPDVTDTLVGKTTTDTLTNKTLTSPAINTPTGIGGTYTAITGLGIRDTSAAFDVTIACTSSSTISAGRTITVDVANASKTIKITPLSNFSTLSDGSTGQVLTTSGSGAGYSWASSLTTSLTTKNVYIGNPSNIITATDTSLLGDILATTNSGTFTITIASPGVATLVSHGLLTGDAVYLTTTGALPTGLTASTVYYIVKVTADTFSLATSFANAVAGTKINTSGSQSGTHTCVSGGLLTWKQGTRGTIDASAATAGYIGEEIRSFVNNGSPVSLSNNTTANITSITLTPGDWDIAAAATLNGNLTGTGWGMSVGTTSGTLESNTEIPEQRIDSPGMPTTSFPVSSTLPRYRVSISSSTTYYLCITALFSGGTATAYGVLKARRVR